MSLPPTAVSTRLRVTVDPRAMGEWLEAWALRREKNLLRLDLRAARAARVFARRCAELESARSARATSEWQETWNALRQEIAAFLEAHYASPG